MTPASFIAKWSRAALSERAASQEHFLDICRLLGQPTPAEHDATGAEYTFEKGITLATDPGNGSGTASGGKGDRGFADVWWRGKFGWEYKRKGKYKDLADAYRQLCQYREALESPPLLIVSDIARIEIHTNFTNTAPQVHSIALAELAKPDQLDLLRRIFTDPESFRPTVTVQKVTEDIASQFGTLAQALHQRGHDPHQVAHFLMKCMFCLFAEDVDLLPRNLLKSLLSKWQRQPDTLCGLMTQLFAAMASGGTFGMDAIPYFNGGLFDQSPALPLTESEVGVLMLAAKQDWSAVEPAIFGTLFERSLDPTKRAQIGAHYTSRDDILLIVEPVVMAPLRRQWQEVQNEIEKLIDRRRNAKTPKAKKANDDAIAKALRAFLDHLGSIRILDPACGSGNFLYVAIQQLLHLEKEVITYAAQPEISIGLFPGVRPTQLHGIEINPYASELAQVVIWIGYLQWMRDNGFNAPRNPILQPLKTIENRDAILDLSDPQHPAPAQWPQADFIIGNPPFLGSKVFRQNGLSDEYVAAMYAAFDLPRTSDLCCYWFELARTAIVKQKETRVGLLATQGIRGQDNRTVLQRIKQTGDIFMAWSDREWILDGAAVHVSMIGFDTGTDKTRTLDGHAVTKINADLTSDADTTAAALLPENKAIGFMGDTKQGDFDINWTEARRLLAMPNPQEMSNADVIRPWSNGRDVTQRPRAMWIVDFPETMAETDAAKYEAAFEHIRKHVKPWRDANHKSWYRDEWWVHYAPRSEMRRKIEASLRFIATPNLTKYRLFVFIDSPTLPDHQLIVFARSDDYFFGVLHSAIHELWALRMGTQLEDRPRYTPTSCFETFPLPWPPTPGSEPTEHPAYLRIGSAAKELNEQRERWLNPPQWIDPLAKQVDAMDKFEDVPPEARPLIRLSAIMALAAKDARLKKRTLTNLYNERPTWLRLAHEKLDRAVLAAYLATDPAGGWSEDWAKVWIDSGAGQPLPAGHALEASRAQVDQAVLANLLRLNQARC